MVKRRGSRAAEASAKRAQQLAALVQFVVAAATSRVEVEDDGVSTQEGSGVQAGPRAGHSPDVTAQAPSDDVEPPRVDGAP